MTDWTLPHPKWMTREEAKAVWIATYAAARVKYEHESSERAVAIANNAVPALLEERETPPAFRKVRSKK